MHLEVYVEFPEGLSFNEKVDFLSDISKNIMDCHDAIIGTCTVDGRTDDYDDEDIDE